MPILILPETASTMEEARQRMADASVEGVLALRQTAGRGRLGRAWMTFDAPHGMACTYIVRQPCAHLPLVAALAVYEALGGAEFEGLGLKWPNDVLLYGKKVAGILCEATPNGALVGVGVNLAAPATGVPEGFVGGFLNTPQTPENISEKIRACLFAALDLYQQHGWAYFDESYAKACTTFGQNITWRGAEKTQDLTGLARGLNKSGHLEVVADDGTVHVISGGDIMAQAKRPS